MAAQTPESQQLVIASDSSVVEIYETAARNPGDFVEGRTYVAKLPGRSQPVLIRKKPQNNKDRAAAFPARRASSQPPAELIRQPSTQLDGNDARRLSTYQLLQDRRPSQVLPHTQSVPLNTHPVAVDGNGNFMIGGVAYAPVPGQSYVPQDTRMVSHYWDTSRRS